MERLYLHLHYITFMNLTRISSRYTDIQTRPTSRLLLLMMIMYFRQCTITSIPNQRGQRSGQPDRTDSGRSETVSGGYGESPLAPIRSTVRHHTVIVAHHGPRTRGYRTQQRPERDPVAVAGERRKFADRAGSGNDVMSARSVRGRVRRQFVVES